MKNKEKYAKEIVEITSDGHHFAYDTHFKRVVPCNHIQCFNCLFHGKSSCRQERLKWANGEYTETKDTDSKYKILHRGKSKHGDWIYGKYISYKSLADEEPTHIIVTNGGRHFDIDPKTLGTYSNVMDKCQQLVFTDDIIQDDQGNRARVVFDKGAFLARYPYKSYDEYLSYSTNRIKVIGNIHDDGIDILYEQDD